MISAREYQSRCVETIYQNFFKKNDQLISLPTASGKTIIFTLLLKKCLDVYPQLKACVLVNQVKLVTQTQDKLKLAIDETKTGLVCGSLGEQNDQAAITVASVQTISRATQRFDVLIIDEAHNADNSSTYSNYIDRLKVTNPKLKIVRFTATPFTTQGYIFGEGKPNAVKDFEMTMGDMINLGYIVAPTFKATDHAFDVSKLRTKRKEYIMRDVEELSLDEKKIQEQVADAIPKLVGRNKVVWSCTCIKHAQLVQAEIQKYEPCAIIHSKLGKRHQRYEIESFEKYDCRHITSVTMVSEGYDFPAIDAIVAMRPTRSPVLYVQLVGRGLRLHPGKEDCLFLDYGQIVENLGAPWDPLVIQKRKGLAEKRVIICPQCMTINFLPAKNCTDCGFEFYAEEKKKREMAKSLDREAAMYDLKVNETPTFELPIFRVTYDHNYISKKGHECLKVSYATLKGEIHQYFKKGSSYHRDFTRDLHLMGDPKTLVVEKKGKWYNAKAAKWSA